MKRYLALALAFLFYLSILPAWAAPPNASFNTTRTNDIITKGPWVDVRAFGASPEASAAVNVASFQAALDALNTANGGTLLVPAGTYSLSAAIRVYPKTTILGVGRMVSILLFTHTGDGINSTHPINSSTAVDIKVAGLGIINTNVADTGGGFVDVGGTYVDVEDCYFSGWKYGVILDQTELAHIEKNNFVVMTTAGIWLVNGDDHTVSASQGYTNRILIKNNQLNTGAGTINIIDDGGSAHEYTGNNFNGGATGIRIASVSGFVLQGNEAEVHTSAFMDFFDNTYHGGDVVGDSGGGIISGNLLISVGFVQIYIDYVHGLKIEGNYFGQATGAEVYLKNTYVNRATGVYISGNNKLITGTFRSPTPFLEGWGDAIARINFEQAAVTYVASGISTGPQTVTPATKEAIHRGSRLFVVNADGTNGENIVVTTDNATAFTATFASSKAANWLVYGLSDTEYGTWTPILIGEGTPGSQTYTVQVGSYYKNKTFVHVKGTIDIDAFDNTIAGSVYISGLPFYPSATANTYSVASFGVWDGITFPAGFTQLSGIISPNSPTIYLRRMGSGKTSAWVQGSELDSTFTVTFEAAYYTH